MPGGVLVSARLSGQTRQGPARVGGGDREELLEELGDTDVAVHLACAKGPVRDVLARTRIPELITGSHMEVHSAVEAAKQLDPITPADPRRPLTRLP